MDPARAIQFDRLTGKGVKVAVVDSGVDPLNPQASGLIRGVDLSIDANGSIRTGVAVTDCAGHGTACAGILRKIAPAVDLYSVRILDESLRADGRLLVEAIRWSIEQEIDVVNLSLGTTDGSMRRLLLDICDQAAEAGVIVVAATTNSAGPSYPACLGAAIGVGSLTLQGLYGYVYQRGVEPECLAHGGRQLLRWSSGKTIWVGGNSFAAPRIAGIVALIRERFPGLSLQGVRQSLEHNSTRDSPARSSVELSPVRPMPVVDRGYPWISRAILHPFTKEMHAFVRFDDLIGFEIAGIIDLPLRGNVGKDAGEAAGADPSGTRIVARIDRITETADTLILGYTGELGRLRGEDITARWLAVALERRLHVFSFQSLAARRYEKYRREARVHGLRFVAPEVPADEEGAAVLAPLEPVDVPVLGVFGTSSSQGKFTLQLALRRGLAACGYRVGQIGTEPHAQLLGMDCAFPMGHASTVNLPLSSYPAYLDRKVREICWGARPDLIIAGSQSGTIPFDLDDPRTLALPSLAFLLGVKPDACVLVINGDDAASYIQHTIEALGAIGKCPVIALAMSDKRKVEGNAIAGDGRLSDTEMAESLRRLEERFAVPAVSIAAPSGARRLVERVVAQFSQQRQPPREEPNWQKKRA